MSSRSGSEAIGRARNGPRPAARQILDKRYARRDGHTDEYVERVQTLGG